MPNVSASIELSAAAPVVWSRISRFDDANWIPGTKECTVEGSGVGAIRTVITGDGARIREKLLSHDEAGLRYSYAIIEAPMPISDYVSHVTVEKTAGGSRVTWSCTFEAPADMTEAIRGGLEGLFRSTLDGLKASLG